jgi:hypothetical protein
MKYCVPISVRLAKIHMINLGSVLPALALFILSITTGAIGCSSINKIQPGTQIICPQAEPRVTMDCSHDIGLKKRVVTTNASLGIFGVDGVYEEKAIGKITDATYQMALKLEHLCKAYNSCIMSSADYKEQTNKIRSRLEKTMKKHQDFTQSLPKAIKSEIKKNIKKIKTIKLKSKKVVAHLDEMWGVVLPNEDQKRLRLGYQITVEPSQKNSHHSSPFIHQDGASLYSKDHFRFTFFSKIKTYVYIVLLSSEGEVSVMFPHTEIQVGNPLSKSQKVSIPKDPELSFELDDKKGLESIQIIASLNPLPKFNEMIQSYVNRRAQTSKSTHADSEDFLSIVGQLICKSINLEKKVSVKTSSVKCGQRKTRGIRLARSKSQDQGYETHRSIPLDEVSGILVATPTDSVVVYQHMIDHL